MITVCTNDFIDLEDVENLRKWIEYMPECFTSNLNNTMHKDRLIEDRFILYNINNLYSFIEETTGNKPDVENKHFSIGQTTLEQHEKFNKIKSNIPNFDIQKYAKLKLTKDEQAICYTLVKRCTLENSDEIMNEIEGIHNFYLRSYAKYLLIHLPESNYRFSANNIRKRVSNANKRLVKKFKRIRRKEADAWEHAKDRIYY